MKPIVHSLEGRNRPIYGQSGKDMMKAVLHEEIILAIYGNPAPLDLTLRSLGVPETERKLMTDELTDSKGKIDSMMDSVLSKPKRIHKLAIAGLCAGALSICFSVWNFATGSIGMGIFMATTGTLSTAHFSSAIAKCRKTLAEAEGGMRKTLEAGLDDVVAKLAERLSQCIPGAGKQRSWD
jgi:hypothetical protein